jgi:hypothetical protein
MVQEYIQWLLEPIKPLKDIKALQSGWFTPLHRFGAIRRHLVIASPEIGSTDELSYISSRIITVWRRKTANVFTAYPFKSLTWVK